MEDYKYKLSIIVPIYNVEKYLERCVDSLLSQDVVIDDYEIILVDDGSADNSYKIAEKISQNKGNFQLFRQENQGASVARNLGIKNARGKFLMFVDSDDMLIPNTIGRILKLAEKHNLDVCSFRMLYYDSTGKEHIGGIQPFKKSEVYSGRYALTHGATAGSVCSSIYNSIMIKKHNLWFLKGIYHQDSDFNLRVFAVANRVQFFDDIVYSYTWNPNSSTVYVNLEKKIKLLNDDITIVKNIREFSENNECGRLIKKFYLKHGNSLVVSVLLQLIKNRSIPKHNKMDIFLRMKSLQLYPIKGNTNSWKTTLLVYFLNLECLYKKLL